MNLLDILCFDTIYTIYDSGIVYTLYQVYLTTYTGSSTHT